MKLTIVDVFAERPLAGNQLAVVQNVEGLSDESMQAIAREMNFSETTFVTAEQDGRATVRIFTPAWENTTKRWKTMRKPRISRGRTHRSHDERLHIFVLSLE